jgi:hypothetical protein
MAECVQTSARRHKSSDNLPSSERLAACPATVSPSTGLLKRLDSIHPPHPRRSNPHSTSRDTHVPLPRFPPLEVCVRRPPVHAAPPSWGRHPQTFTKPELTELIRSPGPRGREKPTSHPIWGRPILRTEARFVTVQYIDALGYRGNPAAASSPSKGANVECARKWLRRTPGKLANNRSTVVSRSCRRPNLVRQMTTYPCEGR